MSTATLDSLSELKDRVLSDPSDRRAWPIQINRLGETMYLRLEQGKKRIVYDWVVPERLRDAIGERRIKKQIPRTDGVPRHEDPGHNVDKAIEWAGSWLRDMVMMAEGAPPSESGVRELNDITLERLIWHFKRSTDWPTSEGTQQQYAKWCDFLEQVYPGRGFKLNRVDRDTDWRIVDLYQQNWERVLDDGTVRREDGVKYNTAVRVSELFRRICAFALSKSIGPNRYLLDADPYLRIPKRDLPRHLRSKSKPRSAADTGYVEALFRHADDVTPSGQWKAMLAIERYTARRISEGRPLARCDYLKTADEIERALREMRCVEFFKGRHLRDDEIEATAALYAKTGGAIYFRMRNVKQANQGYGETLQYDVVIPIGKKLAAILDDYIENHWNQLGLPADAPLFPSQRLGLVNPTPKSTVMSWLDRAEEIVAEREPKVRRPHGETHSLRKRARALAEDHGIPKPTIGLYAAWSALTGDAMDDHYLPIQPKDLVRLANILDEHA